MLSKFLKLFASYEARNDKFSEENWIFPKVVLFSDGSGKVVDGEKGILLEFNSEKELINFLKNG